MASHGPQQQGSAVALRCGGSAAFPRPMRVPLVSRHASPRFHPFFLGVQLLLAVRSSGRSLLRFQQV